jgi:hypothetical protein
MAAGMTLARTDLAAAAVSRRQHLPVRKKLLFLLLISAFAFLLFGLIGEAVARLFWKPRYTISCDRWVVGSGLTSAGRKWWPETTYLIQSAEFRVRFRTNGQGYRSRAQARQAAHPYRIAFVGDSFTEGMQVDDEKTFCARLERGLAGSAHGREVVCENYGVAATGLFDYWHRITHDVLQPAPPDALVLCIYPGNDFMGDFPDDAFDTAGKPLREYFQEPGWPWHVVTWLNLHTRFGAYLQQKVALAWHRWGAKPYRGPLFWWNDPALAAGAGDAPMVRRCRALFQAIHDECQRSGTKLCILVVGPVANYRLKDGQSPLGRILADWQIDVPVIDIAAPAFPLIGQLLFPRDGHLNEEGHSHVASAALAPLRGALGLPDQIAQED